MRKILLPIVTVFCLYTLADEYVTSVALPSGETRQFRDAAAWGQIDSITQSISSIDFSDNNSNLISTIEGTFAKEPFSNAVLSVGLNLDTNTVAAINALIENGDSLPFGGAVTVGALLIALAAAVASLKKNKADASSIPYSLVEVQKGSFGLTNRAMNHVTEERNNNGIWEDYYNSDAPAIPPDAVTLSEGNLLFSKYGVLLTSKYYGSATTIEDVESDTYSFSGSVEEPSITFTPKTENNKQAEGTLVANITIHGDPVPVRVTGIQWTTDSDFRVPGEFPYNGNSYTIEGYYGAASTEENPIVTPVVGENLNCQIEDGSSGETLEVDSIVVESVSVLLAACEGTATVSWADKGIVWDDMGYSVYANTGKIYLWTSGLLDHPSSFNDFINSQFEVDIGTNLPKVGTSYTGNIGVAIIDVNLVLQKPGIALNPSAIEEGKSRDFVVVADATTANLQMQITGVKATSPDTWTLGAGRNLIFVTEAVQGGLYASRKLISEES